MTVLLSVVLSVVYCTVSSVAAPPRHPAPSISNTSDVLNVQYRVGARECGFAYESTCNCQWCVRVSVVARVTQWRATTKRAIIQVECT